MCFSLRLNNDLTLSEYVVLAQAAERAGFDQFWVSNDLFLRSAPVILSAVAQATKRLPLQPWHGGGRGRFSRLGWAGTNPPAASHA